MAVDDAVAMGTAARGALGRYGEEVAAAHLVAAGLTIVARNWRCREGEVDIIALDGDVLVMCEVKTRRGVGFGTPLDAVTPAKAARLRRLAVRWLADQRTGAVTAAAEESSRATRRCASTSCRSCGRCLVRRRSSIFAARSDGCVLMALARAWSVALAGVQGTVVEVEADLAPGLPGLTIIGLPDAALSESRDRVRAAVLNSGEPWPQRRITLGLSPATLPKHGSGFDISMAVAVLSAGGGLPTHALEGVVFFGELGLDGRVRPIRGVLPAAMAAAAAGFSRVVVPSANAAEAALVPGLDVWPAASLRELVAALRSGQPPEVALDAPVTDDGSRDGVALAREHFEVELDLSDVLGQPSGRRAVEVAAAGGHHALLLGDPGTGKTMLAARLPGLLPELDRAAALEVTAVHSIAGVLPGDCPLVTRPPFRDPHHTTSVAALVGGGSGMARPGVASLAHHGVLFLDEAPEFASGVLDALRQPLESGHVTIARSGGIARYPARFLLVLAANPCGCATSSATTGSCTCSSLIRRRYLNRLSGPLLDRVDLQVRMDPVSRAELLADRVHIEQSSTVAARVLVARSRASERLAGSPWRTNSDVPGRELRDRWAPARPALAAAERALDAGRLSARGLDRVLRVAWTLADLADRTRPTADDIDEALYLRTGVAA